MKTQITNDGVPEARCPKCGKKTQSAMISLKKGNSTFFCQKCGFVWTPETTATPPRVSVVDWLCLIVPPLYFIWMWWTVAHGYQLIEPGKESHVFLIRLGLPSMFFFSGLRRVLQLRRIIALLIAAIGPLILILTWWCLTNDFRLLKMNWFVPSSKMSFSGLHLCLMIGFAILYGLGSFRYRKYCSEPMYPTCPTRVPSRARCFGRSTLQSRYGSRGLSHLGTGGFRFTRRPF